MLSRKSIIILAGFLAVLLLVSVIGRQIILGGTAPQTFQASSPASETISAALNATAGTTLTEGKDYEIQKQKYFQGQNWIVATVTPKAPKTANAALVVLKLNGATYEVVAGPGTDFSAAELQSMPTDVAQYVSGKGDGSSDSK